MITFYGIGLIRTMKRAFNSTSNIIHYKFVRKVKCQFQYEKNNIKLVDKLFIVRGFFLGVGNNHSGAI